MLDYNKLLEIENISFEYLDKDTLINWSLIESKEDEEGLKSWVCVEVWLDEDNEIKILDTSDYDSREITDKLTSEQKNHIYKLVKKSVNTILKEDVKKGDLIVISAEANIKDVSLAENSEDGLASVFRVKEVLVDEVLIDGLRDDLGARVSKDSIFKVFNTIEDYNVWLNHIN